MSRAHLASDRAAQWIIAQEDGEWTEADQAKFDAWLVESEGNKAAYWRLKHSWREADRIGALGRGVADQVEPLPRYRKQRRWLASAIAASIVAVVGTTYLTLQTLAEPKPMVAAAEYATAVGGRRTVAFPDGSRIQLNTASLVRASVTPERREVWLDRGEAFFEVARDEDRPFVVHAGNRQITVLGTKFAVRRDGDKVTVTVLEGRVRVDELTDNRAVRSAVIGGGDIALAQGQATLVTTRSEERVTDALAWRSGMLRFNQASLSEVAMEFNRYNAKKLVVTDAQASNIRIGGMFPASNPEAFVRLLRDAYGLTLKETPTTIEISS